MKVTDEMI